MPPTLRFALALGLAVGLGEAAVRASPVRGFDLGQTAQWVALSVAYGTLVALGGWAGAWALHRAASRWLPLLAAKLEKRPWAVVAGLVGGLLVAVNYRYEFVLNEFARDPKVWAGVPGAFVAGALGVGAFFAFVAPGPRALLAVAALGAVGVGVRSVPARGAIGPGEANRPPSVLIISMDTVRADAVIGKPVYTRLSKEGTSFSQAIAAAPITEPSHLAMLSGVSPYRSGIVSNGTDLGERPALVAHAFSRAGYLTAGFVAGFPLHGKYGWRQGMAVWDDDFGAWPGAESLSLQKLWNQFGVKEHALRERSAALVLDRAARWLSAHREETTFAFVHFYDAHGPYVSERNAELGPPPTDGAPLALPPYWPAGDRAITSPDWLARAYDNEVVDVDAAVGRLLDALGDRLDDTVVVLTADHGESLTEHSYLFDHGDNLYDPALRIPLVVRWPAKVRAGALVSCQVGGADVAPTVLALAGLSDDEERDGRSLVPELTGEACRDEPVVASTTAGRFVATPPVDHALRAAGKKLIKKESGAVELYDLLLDPGETRNLAPSPESEAAMAHFESILAGQTRAVSPEMDAATRAALIELGYIEKEPSP